MTERPFSTGLAALWDILDSGMDADVRITSDPRTWGEWVMSLPVNPETGESESEAERAFSE
jgi:hypothetical protein